MMSNSDKNIVIVKKYVSHFTESVDNCFSDMNDPWAELHNFEQLQIPEPFDQYDFEILSDDFISAINYIKPMLLLILIACQ